MYWKMFWKIKITESNCSWILNVEAWQTGVTKQSNNKQCNQTDVCCWRSLTSYPVRTGFCVIVRMDSSVCSVCFQTQKLCLIQYVTICGATWISLPGSFCTCFQYIQCLFINIDGTPLQHGAGRRRASCSFLILQDQLALPHLAKQFPSVAFSLLPLLLFCKTKGM